jgi:hypothetical protein
VAFEAFSQKNAPSPVACVFGFCLIVNRTRSRDRRRAKQKKERQKRVMRTVMGCRAAAPQRVPARSPPGF